MNATKLLITIIATVSVSGAGASGILPAPRVVEASDASYDAAVIVTWTTVKGADSYRVYRNDSDDWTNADEIGVTSDTVFIDPVSSRDPRQLYHYWIAAEAGRAVSPLSAPDTGRPNLHPGALGPNHRLRQNFRRLRAHLNRQDPPE